MTKRKQVFLIYKLQEDLRKQIENIMSESKVKREERRRLAKKIHMITDTIYKYTVNILDNIKDYMNK